MKALFLILSLGLALVPFAVWPGLDSRDPKMAVAMVFALALSLVGIYKGLIGPVRNKWLIAFIGYLLISVWLAPSPIMQYADLKVGAFWLWQPIAQILIFFLMYVTISSVSYCMDAKHKDIVLLVMTYAGLIVAVYSIFQFFGVDQFYRVSDTIEAMNTPSARVGATLGNPTISSAFIAILIPMALYARRYWIAIVMFVAVLMSNSHVSIGAMIVSLVSLYALRTLPRGVIIFVWLAVIAVACVCLYLLVPAVRGLIVDSGRFHVWGQIIRDINSPIAGNVHKTYPFTGLGIGSFKYIFHIKNASTFFQAHNEYLEMLYSVGIIGFILFIMSLFTALRGVYEGSRIRVHLLASLICSMLCAGGSFIWQNGAIAFYSLTMLGFLGDTEE